MKFSDKKEKKIQNKFIQNGYLIFDIENKKNLNLIKKKITQISIQWAKKNSIKIVDKKNLLDNIHKYINAKMLNQFRLFIYNKINGSKDFQKIYYNLARKYLEILCGNELVMQKKCNLSIQLPRDDSSLLPLHSDVWTGDSEYEIVFWLPLVNVYKTKSMFILSPDENNKFSKNLKKAKSIDDIYLKVKKKAKWLKIDYGKGLLFTQNLMHGNIINKEKGTRWSFNCRFKSVFSPYRDKEIGSFFTPITLKPTTILGMNYKLPDA